MLEKINILLAVLVLASCNPSEPKHVSTISAAYEDVIQKVEATTVFAARVDDSIMQVTFAVGETEAGLYEPILLQEDKSLVRAVYLGDGCIMSRTERISTDKYKNITDNQDSTHIILCPAGDNGLVGATFNRLPEIQVLPILADLGDVTEKYL